MTTAAAATAFTRQYFHGTRAQLNPGDEIRVGFACNMPDAGTLSWVYCAATLDAAIWGAELAAGEGSGRIYVVEPTGELEDDPNLTDKRFPGNPTQSYRSRNPLRIVGEVVGWQGHPREQVKAMKDGLARLAAEGRAEIID